MWWTYVLPPIITGLVSYFVSIWKAKRDAKCLIEKSQIEKHDYIYKSRFDSEFRMYQNLSEVFLGMTAEIRYILGKDYPILPEDPEVTFLHGCEHYEPACALTKKAEDTLYKYAPFINEGNYLQFQAILEKCKTQIHWFPLYRGIRLKTHDGLDYNQSDIDAFKERHKEIGEMQEKLITDLRKYLLTL